MSVSEFVNLLGRQGVLYRFDGLKNGVAVDGQFTFVLQTGTKNLALEFARISTDAGEFAFHLHFNRPYTGGSFSPLNRNYDPSAPAGQLEAQVVTNPIPDVSPVPLPDSNGGLFTSSGELDLAQTLIVPAGSWVMLVVDNLDRDGRTADMILTFYCREG